MLSKEMETLKSDILDAWAEGEHERLTDLLTRFVRENFKGEDLTDAQIVAGIKHEFESDLPPRELAKAADCDIRICQNIRWMGDNRGVIDRSGSDRKSIPPSVRREVNRRDGFQCVKCGEGSEDILQEHHIIPLNQGGMNFQDNLATLCEDCHKEAHAGDFKKSRIAYQNKTEFWEDFCDDT